MAPPPLKIFDGDPNKLAIFLDHVLGHLHCYALAYPTQRAMVNAVAANLEREAEEWVATLHDEAPKRRDAGMFLGELWARFKDEAKAQQAEGEIRELKQRGRPVKEYI